MNSVKIVDIKLIKENPANPRIIKDDKFKKLVKSVKDFPEMLNIRPIVVNSDMMVLGGNMRLKACIDAGMNTVPVYIADTLDDAKQREFIIKDNVGFGEWDWDILANEWNDLDLQDWALPVPITNNEEDYFAIDEIENNAQVNKSTDDGYSTFELIMLHENKIKLIDTINLVKRNLAFEKQEDALMEIIRTYNKK